MKMKRKLINILVCVLFALSVVGCNLNPENNTNNQSGTTTENTDDKTSGENTSGGTTGDTSDESGENTGNTTDKNDEKTDDSNSDKTEESSGDVTGGTTGGTTGETTDKNDEKTDDSTSDKADESSGDVTGETSGDTTGGSTDNTSGDTAGDASETGGSDSNTDSDTDKNVEPSGEKFETAATSVQMAKNMAIGWNLGNALDASSCDAWAYSAGLAMEYSWLPHKQATSKALIKAVKAAGFKTIRIPVSWHNHMDKTTYKIDSAWMNRVKELVDWSLAEGMCVIVDIHHDNLTEAEIKTNPGFCLSTDSAVQTKSKNYITSVWTQISSTFAEYDDRLVFELLNEPRCVGTDYEWGFWGANASKAKTYCDIITAYEQAALDVIRTSGGKNADRFVMAPGYAAAEGSLSSFKLPTDTASDRLLLSVHGYTPGDFALEGDKKDYDQNKAYIESSIDSLFKQIKNNYVDKGIGVVMGEASASDKDNLSSRIKWADYYFTKAHAAGIPVILWDNERAIAMGDAAGGENHGYFNRVTCAQTWPTLIETMMKAVCGENAGGSETGSDNTEETPGEITPENPETPVSEIVIFDAATASAPAGSEIVTIDGVKYLKVTPNGYSTSLTVSAVNVTAGQTLVVTMKADNDDAAIQVVIKAANSSWTSVCGENASPTMNPLSSTVKDYSAAITTSDTVTIIQPMVQTIGGNWDARSDTTIYISKIIAK